MLIFAKNFGVEEGSADARRWHYLSLSVLYIKHKDFSAKYMACVDKTSLYKIMNISASNVQYSPVPKHDGLALTSEYI
jgi:hypothetical protein